MLSLIKSFQFTSASTSEDSETWILLTFELLRGQPAQSFQILTPICLDQFLQRNGRKSESLRSRRFNLAVVADNCKAHTTASVIHFKPKSHLVVFLASPLGMVPMLLELCFKCRSWCLLIEGKLPRVTIGIWILTPSSQNNVTRCKQFETLVHVSLLSYKIDDVDWYRFTGILRFWMKLLIHKNSIFLFSLLFILPYMHSQNRLRFAILDVVKWWHNLLRGVISAKSYQARKLTYSSINDKIWPGLEIIIKKRKKKKKKRRSISRKVCADFFDKYLYWLVETERVDTSININANNLRYMKQ